MNEPVDSIAETPVRGVWHWLSESVGKIAVESSILVKGLHLFIILFLVVLLVCAIIWFIFVKTTQITIILAFGALSISMIFDSDG